MKKLYLICNAHLDTIWQWPWEEGAAAGVATFRSAADLLGEFDYIFCHNEAMLYGYVEQYDPALFKRMQSLVNAGKWKIMGGWYLQPDVLLTSGESIVRQVLTGKKYFAEKFGAETKTAVNFDSFGHSRGLVQIIKKCGQENYIAVRPLHRELNMPSDYFIWRGYDGSEIKAFRSCSYKTFLGRAAEGIQKYIEDNADEEAAIKLWGVGNHGGGPSRKDLRDIAKLQEESEVEIVHSHPEEAFENIAFDSIWEKPLTTCMPGCYTSLMAVKQKYIALENSLFSAEKIASAARLAYPSFAYPESELNEACRCMMTVQFHDVLSGTCIRSGEENALRVMGRAFDALENAHAKAMFCLAEGLKKINPNEYCIAVFNYQPYKLQTDVVFEFCMEKNTDPAFMPVIKIYDAARRELPMQVIKEDSNVSIDCRKRIVFSCELEPLSLNRFDVSVELVPNAKKPFEQEFSVRTPYYTAEVDGQTGLLRSFCLHGKEYLQKEGFGLYVYGDNEDPWAMAPEQLTRVGEDPVPVSPARAEGIFRHLRQVTIIEDGVIQKTVEALFAYGQSRFAIDYIFYKNRPYFDLKVKAFWQDRNKMLRLHIPLREAGRFRGQQMFGQEELAADGSEQAAQRFVCVGEDAFSVLNRSSYGCSMENGVLKLSLLRGITYCAHPVDDMPVVYYDRYLDAADLGEREFHYRIGVWKNEELEREAQNFCNPPYALEMSPAGRNIPPQAGAHIELSNPNIVLEALKKKDGADAFVLRLMNNSENAAETMLHAGRAALRLSFGRFEVKTVVLEDGKLTESEYMLI